MPFSVDTKNELARVTVDKKCCQIAELAALIKTDGLIQLSGRHKMSLHMITESAAVARKAFAYLKNIFGVHTDVLIKKKINLKKNNVYLVRLLPGPKVNTVLQTAGIIDEKGRLVDGIKPDLLAKDCCRRAYLRGVFLGSGSVSDPEGSYHLEIIVNDDGFQRDLCSLMKHYDLNPKVNRRKKWDVVYLKDSDEIIKLLNLMGAYRALLDFENIRIFKEMRNQVNRLVNCETANLNKTVNAAVKQVEDIKLIEKTLGLNNLPENLRLIAELRLKYPDSSLKELGEMMEPKIGKSGVNHRMRKIQKIAESIRDHQ